MRLIFTKQSHKLQNEILENKQSIYIRADSPVDSIFQFYKHIEGHNQEEYSFREKQTINLRLQNKTDFHFLIVSSLSPQEQLKFRNQLQEIASTEGLKKHKIQGTMSGNLTLLIIDKHHESVKTDKPFTLSCSQQSHKQTQRLSWIDYTVVIHSNSVPQCVHPDF